MSTHTSGAPVRLIPKIDEPWRPRESRYCCTFLKQFSGFSQTKEKTLLVLQSALFLIMYKPGLTLLYCISQNLKKAETNASTRSGAEVSWAFVLWENTHTHTHSCVCANVKEVFSHLTHGTDLSTPPPASAQWNRSLAPRLCSFQCNLTTFK